jgi:hypothetical protein
MHCEKNLRNSADEALNAAVEPGHDRTNAFG